MPSEVVDLGERLATGEAATSPSAERTQSSNPAEASVAAREVRRGGVEDMVGRSWFKRSCGRSRAGEKKTQESGSTPCEAQSDHDVGCRAGSPLRKNEREGRSRNEESEGVVGGRLGEGKVEAVAGSPHRQSRGSLRRRSSWG